MTREEYEAKKQALIGEIERVFGGIERKDGVPFSLVEFSKHGLTDEARDELHLLGDKEARWQDVPLQLIDDYGHFILGFSDAQSFRYYLPAFLTWYLCCVDYQGEEDCAVPFVVSDLLVDLRVEQRIADYQRKKFTFIDADQARTVADFLVFQIERLIFLDEEGELDDGSADYYFHSYDGDYKSCRRALDNYWGQFWGGEIPTLSERQMTIRVPKKVPEPQKLAAYEAKKIALIEEIERVFDGVEREDGVTLHEADAIDNYE